MGTNTPKPTEKPSEGKEITNTIKVGDTIRIDAPYDKYIVSGYKFHHNIHQVKNETLADNRFNWDDNGIPAKYIDLVDSKGKKLPNSDKTIPKEGDYFVFNRNFKVIKKFTDNGTKMVRLQYGNESSITFWVVESRCVKV